MRRNPFPLKWLIILVFTSVCLQAQAGTPSELASSPEWLRLLHMKKRFPFGKLRSEVEPGTFFFAPDGNHNPQAEMEATLNAFEHPHPVGKMNLSPQCAFPARYHFLKTELHLNIVDDVCPELESYLAKINGDSLSLIFSAAYPHSPPSMFGHTMLRIHSKDRAELLDFGINYSALAGEHENSIAFAVLGLMGGYFGQFGVVPYYMKVNEYNHAESRDLWEYDLHFSKEEIKVFLWHLWELDHNALFRYYFFDENCSYRILTLLEVAKPDWNLSQFFFEVIPAETVKRLVATDGAVTGVHHRPSLHVQMAQRFDLLSPAEKKEAFDLIAGKETELHQKPVEAAISYFQFRRLKGRNHLEIDDQKIYTRLLIARAKMGVSSEALPPTNEQTRPDLGHAPYQLGVGGGYVNQYQLKSAFAELRFKFAYHDLLNSDVGYIPFSQVDFLNIGLRYFYDQRSLWIDHIGLLTVTSLSPMDDLEKQLSWKVDLSYVSPHDLSCLNCHAVSLNGGAGATIGFFSDRVLAYEMALVDLQAGSSLVNGVRFLPTLQTGLISQVTEKYKTQLTGSIAADVWQSARQNHFYEAEWNNSLSFAQNWDARAQAKAVLPGNSQNSAVYREFNLGLNFYF